MVRSIGELLNKVKCMDEENTIGMTDLFSMGSLRTRKRMDMDCITLTIKTSTMAIGKTTKRVVKALDSELTVTYMKVIENMINSMAKEF